MFRMGDGGTIVWFSSPADTEKMSDYGNNYHLVGTKSKDTVFQPLSTSSLVEKLFYFTPTSLTVYV